MSADADSQQGLSAGGANEYTLSPEATPIALPTPKSQEMVLVRRSEISSLKRGVKRAFENPVESAYVWASIWFGVAVAAGFSLLALVGVEGNEVRPGILAAHWTVLFCALFLAGFLVWYGRKNRDQRKTAHEDLIVDLDELSKRAPTQLKEKAGSAQ